MVTMGLNLSALVPGPGSGPGPNDEQVRVEIEMWIQRGRQTSRTTAGRLMTYSVTVAATWTSLLGAVELLTSGCVHERFLAITQFHLHVQFCQEYISTVSFSAAGPAAPNSHTWRASAASSSGSPPYVRILRRWQHAVTVVRSHPSLSVTKNTNKWVSTPYRRNVCLRGYSIHTLVHIYDLDIRPMTLKTFSAMPTRMLNICGKFHWNPSTEYRDNAAHKIDVNGQPDDPKTWRLSPRTADDGGIMKAYLLTTIYSRVHFSVHFSTSNIRVCGRLDVTGCGSAPVQDNCLARHSYLIRPCGPGKCKCTK